MTDSTPGQHPPDEAEGVAATAAPLPGLGDKPTISEVAAWLRQAAQDRRNMATASETEAPVQAGDAASNGAATDAEPQNAPPTSDLSEPRADPETAPAGLWDPPEPEVEPETAPAGLWDPPEPDRPPAAEVATADPFTTSPEEDTSFVGTESSADAPTAPTPVIDPRAPKPDSQPDPVSDSAMRAEPEVPPSASQSGLDPAAEPEPDLRSTSGWGEVSWSAPQAPPDLGPDPVPVSPPLELAAPEASPPHPVPRTAPFAPGPAVEVDQQTAPAQSAYSDLDALEGELATAPTPVVRDDTPPAVPKVGLFSLPEDVPAHPVVLGVPAITLPVEDEHDKPGAVFAVDSEGDIEVIEPADDEAVGDDEDKDARPPKDKRPRRQKRQRVRYPRGQLKERIGFFRRVRAIIGVTIIAVLLGIGLAGLIGGALIFIFLAGRSAITS